MRQLIPRRLIWTRLISMLAIWGALASSVAVPSPARAASLSLSPTTSSVKAGASAYLMVVLAARVDSCRLVALRPDGTGPTLGAITPSKTHVEWSWLVPARTRSAIWRLRATCGPSQATVRLAVDGQSTGRVTLVVDAHVRQFGGPLAAVRTVVPAVVIAPRIKVLAARWWGISANRILARFQAGSSAGQCTAYAAWRRPDVIGRVDSLAYAEYLLRGSTGPLAVDWNADTWAADAQRAGMSTGGVPRAGAVIVFAPGAYGADAPYGHVAVVDSVARDGSFTISEMHAPVAGVLSTRAFSARTARAMASDPAVTFIYKS